MKKTIKLKRSYRSMKLTKKDSKYIFVKFSKQEKWIKEYIEQNNQEQSFF